MKTKRISPGVYEVEGTDLQIVKDVDAPIASDKAAERAYHGDRRYNVTMRDHLAYGPDEVTWIILRGEENLGMYDTLREAKAAAERIAR